MPCALKMFRAAALRQPSAQLTVFQSGTQPWSRPSSYIQTHTLNLLTSCHQTATLITITRRHMDVHPPPTYSTFLVFSVHPRDEAFRAAREVLSRVPAMTENVVVRSKKPFSDWRGNIVCVAGIGSRVWKSVTGGLPQPTELRPFPELRGASRRAMAVSTPGDLLFHIHAERQDICSTFERMLTEALGDAVRLESRTVGFGSFDDTTPGSGFVTDPVGTVAMRDALTSAGNAPDDGEEGKTTVNGVSGSYVIVQKYLHDTGRFAAHSIRQQQQQRDKAEFEDEMIEEDEAGEEEEEEERAPVLRYDVPFGSPRAGEFGTYLIAYSRSLGALEEMVERMVLSTPHDLILNYAQPVTGSTFFAPSFDILQTLGDE